MNRTENNQKTSTTKSNGPAAQERAKAEPTPAPAPNQGDGVGEGNRAATHRYNDGLAKSVARGDSHALAEEGPEGAELEEAEETAKRGEPKITSRR